jgi:transcriptional regulator with XRE-family HTH domain
MSDDPIHLSLDDLSRVMEDRMRVYLAGPLTANDATQNELCRRIRMGAERVLRTRFTVYDPAEMTPPGTDHTADEVFNADHTRTSTADLVFFHVNAPSLGVGIESQIAAEATIPRVIAHPRGVKVSRMFDGVFNPTVARIEYSDPNDFEDQLLSALPSIIGAVKRSAAKRRPALAAIKAAGIGRDIFESRVLLKMSIDQLAAATDVRSCMLRRLERSNEVAATLTLAQLFRISTELRATLAIGAGSIPYLHGPSSEPHITDVHKRSLRSMYGWLRGRKEKWVPDDVVFKMWDYGFPLGTQRAEAARGEDPAVSNQEMSATDWQGAFEEVTRSDDSPRLFL